MKYEYKILVLDSGHATDESILNGLGAEGWRVAQAIAGTPGTAQTNGTDARLTLARPIAAVPA